MVEDGIVKRVPLNKGLANKDYFEILNSDIFSTSDVITQEIIMVEKI